MMQVFTHPNWRDGSKSLVQVSISLIPTSYLGLMTPH